MWEVQELLGVWVVQELLEAPRAWTATEMSSATMPVRLAAGVPAVQLVPRVRSASPTWLASGAAVAPLVPGVRC